MGIEELNKIPEKGVAEYATEIRDSLQARYQELYPDASELNEDEINRLIKDELLGKTPEAENNSLEDYLEISWHKETRPDVLDNLVLDIKEQGIFDDILKSFHDG